MEKLTITITIPKSKSSFVKQLLQELGCFIQPEEQVNVSEFRKKLTNVSIMV